MTRFCTTLCLGLLLSSSLAWGQTALEFADMYTDGTEFSEMLESLDGQTIRLKGYAAPPLKPDLDFFVLTRVQMSVCPFCDDAAEWPPDIVFVELPKNFDEPVFGGFEVVGRLELGAKTEPTTGFVSKVRIIADSVERP